MNKSDYKVTVEIDGIPVSASVIMTLHQRDPFPGGHRYTLQVSGSGLKRIFHSLSLGRHPKPDNQQGENVLGSLSIVLSRVRARDGHTEAIRYFLNSVETVDFAENEIRMEGVCSEVQTNQNPQPMP